MRKPAIPTCIALLATLALAWVARAQIADPAPQTPQRLRALAEHYEKEGLKKEAAQAYEDLIVKDPSTQRVASQRLVQLYIETRQQEKALTWARKIKDDTPDPPAYLAEVYARLGGFPEALAILDSEIAKESDTHRKSLLLTQSAGILEKTGAREKADAALAAAAELVKDLPEHAAAAARLAAFRQRHPVAPPAREAADKDRGGTPPPTPTDH